MITLYSGPVSWLSRKVEIVLHEKALPFRQVLVPLTIRLSGGQSWKLKLERRCGGV